MEVLDTAIQEVHDDVEEEDHPRDTEEDLLDQRVDSFLPEDLLDDDSREAVLHSSQEDGSLRGRAVETRAWEVVHCCCSSQDLLYYQEVPIAGIRVAGRPHFHPEGGLRRDEEEKSLHREVAEDLLRYFA